MARSRKFFTAGAVGVAAIALAASTSVTGAYFSDSHDGTISASTGAVTIEVSNLALSFDKLMPGTFQTKDVTYKATGTGPQDIWLVLPTDPTSATAFLNGQKGTPGATPALGRYGHFAVDGNAGDFTSFNLTMAATPSAADCPVSSAGHGGSIEQGIDATNGYPPYCPVPKAILLHRDLAVGATDSAKITFGYTKLLKAKAAQNSASRVVAPFKIVATQPGILPTDTNVVQ